jgi:hypothetical protein
MAIKEMVNIGGVKTTGFNVSNTVGPDCANKPGDVLLIKAMLAFIYRFVGPHTAGSEIPWGLALNQNSASYDSKLGKAILAYQRKNSPHRIPHTDGIIHPASYLGRVISAADPRRMTITVLHDDCIRAALFSRLDLRGDYTLAFPIFCPAVLGFIIDMTRT